MTTRGELEQRALEILWAAPSSMSVAQVHDTLQQERNLAYTTVMTVLDRLAKKKLVFRERVDRAWQYVPAQSQVQVVAGDLMAALRGVPPQVRVEALATLSGSLSADERNALGALAH